MSQTRKDNPHSFGSTIMSMIVGLADPQPQKEYLERFVEYYGAPLEGLVQRRTGMSEHDARDVVQEFMLVKILSSKNIASRYLGAKTQTPTLTFRAYFKRALFNFAVDKIRARGRDAVLHPAPSEVAVIDDNFDTEWAANLIRQAIDAVKSECKASNQDDIWKVFEARILPACAGQPVPKLADLAKDVGLPNASAAQSRLETAKRKFRRVFRRLVENYLPLESENADEIFQQEFADLLKTGARLRNSVLATKENSDEVPEMLSLFQLLDSPSPEQYSDADCKEIWSDINSMSIEQFTIAVDPSLEPAFRGLSNWGGEPLTKVSDLWTHPNPPLELLQAIKRFAKRQGKEQEARVSYPREICITLYNASIATVWLRMDTRITRDSPERILQRLPIVLSLPWLDRLVRSLLEQWKVELEKKVSIETQADTRK